MKFISASAILASLASTAFAGPLEDFTLGDSATIAYDTQANVFTLDWAGGTTETAAAFSYEYFSFDCASQSFGDGVAAGLSSSFFSNVDGLGGTRAPYMNFQVNLGAVAATSMYTIINGGTDAEIKLCVRNKLSTKDTNGLPDIEVNFQESQITLTINLEAGVATSVGVVERTRNADQKAEQVYNIVTTLCGTTENPAPQGSLVTVCMEPDSIDVKIASLVSFTWEQSNESTVIQSQQAIFSDANVNGLSTISDCPVVKPTKGDTCQFSSVLKADFYQNVAFAVAGTGNALLELNRRRLNAGITEEEEARLLQDLGSEVSVAVPLASADNGPGALKTAGGASFGISALASGVALISAALLA